MFERDSNKVATIFNRNECTEVFVFLGSILEFPNSILRIAEQEAGSVHAIRLESVRDLLSLVRDRSISVRKVFFDDRLATEILRDLELYHAKGGLDTGLPRPEDCAPIAACAGDLTGFGRYPALADEPADLSLVRHVAACPCWPVHCVG